MNLDRRNFHKVSLAALSGLVSGAAGCGKPGAPPAAPPAGSSMEDALSQPTEGAALDVATDLTPQEQLLVDDKHVCRGLNTCKGLGRSKDNSCAGQGSCASIADHACAQQNECKGQGGCGEDPGFNACKGMGGCHVPLMDEAWTKARTAFEAAMKKSGKSVGVAPAKA
jgi:hypothetical protein